MSIICDFALLKRISISTWYKGWNRSMWTRNIRMIKFFFIFFFNFTGYRYSLRQSLIIWEKELTCKPFFTNQYTLNHHSIVKILIFFKYFIITLTFFLIFSCIFKIVVFIFNIRLDIENWFCLRIKFVLNILHLTLHLLLTFYIALIIIINQIVKHFT